VGNSIIKLLNYQMDNKLNQQKLLVLLKNKESGYYEGQGVSQEDLRQVQDRAPQGRGARDLREFET
jgi:hypothetical protein